MLVHVCDVYGGVLQLQRRVSQMSSAVKITSASRYAGDVTRRMTAETIQMRRGVVSSPVS